MFSGRSLNVFPLFSSEGGGLDNVEVVPGWVVGLS